MNNVMTCRCGQEATHKIRNEYMCEECMEEQEKYNKWLNKYKYTKDEKCRKARWDDE